MRNRFRPTGHSWDTDFTIDQAATCTETGSQSIHCQNCDAVKDATEIPATGHSWDTDFMIDQAATCTETGSQSIHCQNCDAVKRCGQRFRPRATALANWRDRDCTDLHGKWKRGADLLRVPDERNAGDQCHKS